LGRIGGMRPRWRIGPPHIRACRCGGQREGDHREAESDPKKHAASLHGISPPFTIRLIERIPTPKPELTEDQAAVLSVPYWQRRVRRRLMFRRTHRGTPFEASALFRRAGLALALLAALAGASQTFAVVGGGPDWGMI